MDTLAGGGMLTIEVPLSRMVVHQPREGVRPLRGSERAPNDPSGVSGSAASRTAARRGARADNLSVRRSRQHSRVLA